jgi:hypothetical protein
MFPEKCILCLYNHIQQLPYTLKSFINEKVQFKYNYKNIHIHTCSSLLMNSYYLKMAHNLLKVLYK